MLILFYFIFSFFIWNHWAVQGNKIVEFVSFFTEENIWIVCSWYCNSACMCDVMWILHCIRIKVLWESYLERIHDWSTSTKQCPHMYFTEGAGGRLKIVSPSSISLSLLSLSLSSVFLYRTETLNLHSKEIIK